MEDLELSEFEQGYLTAFYVTTVTKAMANCCNEEYFGVHIGNRVFDLKAWADEETGNLVCVAYECFENENSEWNTDTSRKWFLKEGV